MSGRAIDEVRPLAAGLHRRQVGRLGARGGVADPVDAPVHADQIAGSHPGCDLVDRDASAQQFLAGEDSLPGGRDPSDPFFHCPG